MLNKIAAVVIDGVAPFEFGVLCEVFGIDRTDDGVPPFEFLVCGERAGTPVSTNVGATLTPDHDLDAIQGANLVAVPAARIRDEYPPAVLDAVRAAHATGATVLSVCSGAFMLGETGLLDGRRCTTHWRYAEAFVDRFPEAKLDPMVLYVDDGDIITSAGTAAGIDACLHLVRRELGVATATAIARRMVVSPQREGGQRQFIDMPVRRGDATSLKPLLDWMLEAIAAEHTVQTLARRAGLSERTFARRFVAETGTTPVRWLTAQRVQHARTLLEDTDLAIEEIARQCGFNTAALLRHHFQRTVGISPNRYRRTFASSALAGTRSRR